MVGLDIGDLNLAAVHPCDGVAMAQHTCSFQCPLARGCTLRYSQVGVPLNCSTGEFLSESSITGCKFDLSENLKTSTCTEYLHAFSRPMNWGTMWNRSAKEGLVAARGDLFLLNLLNCISRWFIWNETLILRVSEIVYILFVSVICSL